MRRWFSSIRCVAYERAYASPVTCNFTHIHTAGNYTCTCIRAHRNWRNKKGQNVTVTKVPRNGQTKTRSVSVELGQFSSDTLWRVGLRVGRLKPSYVHARTRVGGRLPTPPSVNLIQICYCFLRDNNRNKYPPFTVSAPQLLTSHTLHSRLCTALSHTFILYRALFLF